jgi:predicted sulfurtransferase
MRTPIAFACCLIALLAAFHTASTAQSGVDAPRIDQSEFKKLVAAKNVLIVDTRQADSFAAGHMPGALLLPLEGQMTWPEAYEKTVATLVASKKTVVTYCA